MLKKPVDSTDQIKILNFEKVVNRDRSIWFFIIDSGTMGAALRIFLAFMKPWRT
jgi:hypothetical protein